MSHEATQHDRDGKLLERILRASKRISSSAPPMKPFVRFSRYGREKTPAGISYARLLWDFDDLIQKKLLGLAYEIASPDAIVRAGIEQWKDNLADLLRNQKEALEQAVRDGISSVFQPDSTTEAIAERMKPGEHLLYIGCGSGKPCCYLAGQGLHVLGIDTMAPLLEVAKGWATHAGLPVQICCIDAARLGFKPDSFDGFLFGLYGSLPSRSQTLALQKDLSRILRPGGQGFVAAVRKRYTSYWFLMGSRYPRAMTNWLIPHAAADFLFSQADNCEERLMYGLYDRSHTVQSLSAELSHTFEVMDCFYEDDPRYVMAVVRRRSDRDVYDEAMQDDISVGREVSPSRLAKIRTVLERIEHLCDHLEAHTRRVIACFRDARGLPADASLETISASSDIAGFIELLREILGPGHPASTFLGNAETGSFRDTSCDRG
jgi:ubiquinone/menaquinone biosynthesis C-methylase UbiE